MRTSRLTTLYRWNSTRHNPIWKTPHCVIPHTNDKTQLWPSSGFYPLLCAATRFLRAKQPAARTARPRALQGNQEPKTFLPVLDKSASLLPARQAAGDPNATQGETWGRPAVTRPPRRGTGHLPRDTARPPHAPIPGGRPRRRHARSWGVEARPAPQGWRSPERWWWL